MERIEVGPGVALEYDPSEPIPPPTRVSSITVSQDVGGPYPRHKRVTLDLFDDGTVRWRDLEFDY